jgi:hypothetical protein
VVVIITNATTAIIRISTSIPRASGFLMMLMNGSFRLLK